ncbi:cyclopropane-fatty-acyl-phospholipid synthase family protein [Actinoplanes sp. M2I2]|uniref:SAM-dependent methyltransferase n=1 Tax=Actinoplanes sp. M2I2 TaxID=1734444 RepID=UPI002021A368|nr:class I SAM-dependent methyltransferase [Actinoplanes sp. M2I2]
MDWVEGFYSRTGAWWGRAEARIGERDHRRLALLHEHAGVGPRRVLELGSGYGTTAAVAARAGHSVTAVEISDRVDYAAAFVKDVGSGDLTVVKDDFYAVRLEGQFDVVCYWNGFGVGSDADQRRLLGRVVTDWLRPGGVALIDVFNPFVWARWDGDTEHKVADPEHGYEHELFEQTVFDPVTCTAIDTWWEAGRPDDKISQSLRCYTPADLELLIAGTGLHLTAISVGEQTISLARQPGWHPLLREHHEYLAVLRHSSPQPR